MKRFVTAKFLLAFFCSILVLSTSAAAKAAESPQSRFIQQLAEENKYGMVLWQPTTEITLQPNGKMLVDGKETAMTTIFQQKGTTYLPLRAILEALGAEVQYDPTTDMVDIYYGSKKAALNLNNGQVLLNGKEFDKIGVAWQGAKSFVPVRWMVEKLLANMNPEEMFSVQWQADTGAVHLYQQRWEVLTHLPETYSEPELTLYLLVPWGQFPYIQLAEMPSLGSWSFEGLPELPSEFKGQHYTLATTKVPLIPGDNNLQIQLPQGGKKITSPLAVQLEPEAVPFPYRLDARNYPWAGRKIQL